MKPVASLAACLIVAVLAACGQTPDYFPKQLEVEDVLASATSGFFREGCQSRTYRLSRASATAVLEHGKTTFDNATSWSETPLPRSADDYALPAFTVCFEESAAFTYRDLEAALNEPGNYYYFNYNHEGFILVVPRRRIAVFIYDG